MKTLLKILVVVIVLVVGGLLALILTFDVNQYRDQIIAQAEAATGRSFAIDGELGMKLSLIPTISVEGVRVGNTDWGTDEYLLRIGRFEAQAAIMPLLKREIVIKRLLLDDTEINLQSNADGQGNWVFDTGAAEAKDQPAAESGALPMAVIETVAITDVRLRYREPARDEPLLIAVERITLGAQSLDSPLDIEVRAVVDERAITLAGQVGAVATLLDDEEYLVDISGSIAGIDLDLSGTVAHPMRGAGLKLQLGVSAADLAAIGRAADMELPALSPVSLQARVSDARGTVTLEDIKLLLGRSDLGGSLTFTAMAPRSRVQARLAGKLLDLTEILPPPAEAPPAERMFPDDPLPLEGLRAIDADVRLDIAELRHPSANLTDLVLAVALTNGRLSIPTLTAGIAGGTLDAGLSLDASGDIAALDQRLTVRGLKLAELPAVAAKDLIEGAPTDMDINLKGRGQSVADIMGKADGRIRVQVGAGTLTNRAASIGGADLLFKGLQMLNPMSGQADKTILECAVINFPVKAGVASSETGIGLMTSQLSVLGGGSINLASEAIDIGAKPKPREGVGLNLAALTDFMRIGGTLTNPKPVTDARGAAAGAAKVGAAVATGGLSVLAEGLFDRSTSGQDVCAVALGTAAAQPAAESSDGAQGKSALEQTGDKAKAAGESVKKVFKGLFGD